MAGYIGSKAVNLSTTGADINGDANIDGDLSFRDNDKIKLGAGSDLQIYHDAGGDSYITESNASGQLRIQAGNIKIADADGNNFIYMTDLGTGGLVNLYHNGSEKLATTSTGVDITGTLTSDGLTVDGNILLETSGNPTITNKTTGAGNNPVYRLQADTNYWDMLGVFSDADDTLRFRYNDTDALKIANNGDISFYEDTGTTAKFFWDASAESLGLGTTTAPSSSDVKQVISSTTGAFSQYSYNGGAGSAIGSPAASTFSVYTTTGSIGSETYTEAMRINSSGRVGIGTTSPSAPLEVTRSTSGIAQYITNTGSSQAYTAYGNSDNPPWSQDFNTAGGLLVGIDSDESGVLFQGGNYDLRLGTNGTDRMRITSGGSIKMPNVYNDTTASAANLHISSAGGQLFRSTSSARYKNTIANASFGIVELMALRPVTYKGNNDGDTVFGGLIAEEVHDAGLVEFVQYNEEGEPDALAYGNMVSLCIKAIQEQQATITDLKARVATLEAN